MLKPIRHAEGAIVAIDDALVDAGGSKPVAPTPPASGTGEQDAGESVAWPQPCWVHLIESAPKSVGLTDDDGRPFDQHVSGGLWVTLLFEIAQRITDAGYTVAPTPPAGNDAATAIRGLAAELLEVAAGIEGTPEA